MDTSVRALASLSREDRALAVVATTLSGRRAKLLCELLPPDRAQAVGTAVAALLDLEVGARTTLLSAEAARLASPPRTNAGAVHPDRWRRLIGGQPPGVERLLRCLAGEAGELGASPVAVKVGMAVLAARLPATPWRDEVAVSPQPVQGLLRASFSRLAQVAQTMGPEAMKAVLLACPPTVAAWLRARLSPENEEELDDAEPADVDTSLARLAELTRTGGE